jgi:hypothetical protein
VPSRQGQCRWRTAHAVVTFRWCRAGSDSAIPAFIASPDNPRGIKMSGVSFVRAGIAATVLGLSSQDMVAQGLLPTTPQPFGVMSPDPLGPLQKFGDWSPGSEARFTGSERASLPRPPQAHAARGAPSQAQRRLSLAPEPRRPAVRTSARQHEWQRVAAGSGSVLSLASRDQERRPSRQFCFPSATIHFQQNEPDNCNLGAPFVKGRFEELLSR